MKRAAWTEVVARIGEDRPLDLDAALFGPDAGATPRGEGARDPSVQPPASPSTRLLHTRDPGAASIGIRMTRTPADPVGLALHLAALAAQKGIDPIILSAIGRTGLERWGFRVERLPADPAEAAVAEAELSALWNIAVVIDAAEVSALG